LFMKKLASIVLALSSVVAVSAMAHTAIAKAPVVRDQIILADDQAPAANAQAQNNANPADPSAAAPATADNSNNNAAAPATADNSAANPAAPTSTDPSANQAAPAPAPSSDNSDTD
jgi:hypothetical protein